MDKNDVLRRVAERQRLIHEAIKKGRGGRAAAVLDKYVGTDGRKLVTGNLGVADTEVLTNQNNAISFVISTRNVDRDGDIVDPAGYEGSGYALNPVWMFGHGEWSVPIGTARAPDGHVAVYPGADLIKSTCFFDRDDEDADFLYGKCVRKILGATSVAFVPIIAHRRTETEKAYHGDGDVRPTGYLFSAWAHTETSIVAIPANPEAVAEITDSLIKEKSFVSPRMLKALRPMAAVARGRSFSGWCPPGYSCTKSGCVKDPVIKAYKAGDVVVLSSGPNSGRKAMVIADNGEFLTVRTGDEKHGKQEMIRESDVVPYRPYGTKRLTVKLLTGTREPKVGDEYHGGEGRVNGVVVAVTAGSVRIRTPSGREVDVSRTTWKRADSMHKPEFVSVGVADLKPGDLSWHTKRRVRSVKPLGNGTIRVAWDDGTVNEWKAGNGDIVERSLVRKDSFFGSCDRDELGHCKPGTGGGSSGSKPSNNLPSRENIATAQREVDQRQLGFKLKDPGKIDESGSGLKRGNPTDSRPEGVIQGRGSAFAAARHYESTYRLAERYGFDAKTAGELAAWAGEAARVGYVNALRSGGDADAAELAAGEKVAKIVEQMKKRRTKSLKQAIPGPVEPIQSHEDPADEALEHGVPPDEARLVMAQRPMDFAGKEDRDEELREQQDFDVVPRIPANLPAKHVKKSWQGMGKIDLPNGKKVSVMYNPKIRKWSWKDESGQVQEGRFLSRTEAEADAKAAVKSLKRKSKAEEPVRRLDGATDLQRSVWDLLHRDGGAKDLHELAEELQGVQRDQIESAVRACPEMRLAVGEDGRTMAMVKSVKKRLIVQIAKNELPYYVDRSKQRWDICVNGVFAFTEWANSKREAEEHARAVGNFPAEVKVEARKPGAKSMKAVTKMTDKERTQLRKLQDRFVNSAAARKWVSDHGENKPVFEGGPSVDELRRMLYPQWKYKIEQLIQDLGIKSLSNRVAKSEFATGDRVVVTGGPKAGKEGTVIQQHGAGMVRVSFEAGKSELVSPDGLKKKGVAKIIHHEGGKYVLYSHAGKVLGRHDTKEDALAQERAVEANKHKSVAKIDPPDVKWIVEYSPNDERGTTRKIEVWAPSEHEARNAGAARVGGKIIGVDRVKSLNKTYEPYHRFFARPGDRVVILNGAGDAVAGEGYLVSINGSWATVSDKNGRKDEYQLDSLDIPSAWGKAAKKLVVKFVRKDRCCGNCAEGNPCKGKVNA